MNDYLDYIQHHGIKGQKWGVRRFQNEDGTYTDLGNKRRSQDSGNISKRQAKKAAKIQKIKENVKQYDKEYNKADVMQARARKKWDEAFEVRKSLGKNEFQRKKELFKQLIGKGSEAANKYVKMYDKASEYADKADAQSRKSAEAYKKTGSNAISRVINNAKYTDLTKLHYEI